MGAGQYMSVHHLSFRKQLKAFIVINVLLHAINVIGGEKDIGGNEFYYWAIWPLLGWGIGLYFHWTKSKPPFSGDELTCLIM